MIMHGTQSRMSTLALLSLPRFTVLNGRRQGFESRPLAYFLNLLELWLDCALQTPPEKVLGKLLPPGSHLNWAGRHLNIASLWQSFPHETRNQRPELPRDSFAEVLLSESPTFRRWTAELRTSYHQLQSSSEIRRRQGIETFCLLYVVYTEHG